MTLLLTLMTLMTPTEHLGARGGGSRDFIGDMGLVGEEDWAMTTCFNFPPAQVAANPERTEIKVPVARVLCTSIV